MVAGRTNPTSRELSCMGGGGPRRAIPRSRSEGVAVRRYPSSKVRSNGCALLASMGPHRVGHDWGALAVKAMVFPVVMYGCESWTVKKAECRRIDAFDPDSRPLSQ